MRTYYFRIRSGQLIDCNSVPKLYCRGVRTVLLLLTTRWRVSARRCQN